MCTEPTTRIRRGGAALERGVLFPEADERLADGAVVGRLVERSGQCEEAAGPLWLRLRCAVLRLLLVVSGRIAVLRCAVLRRSHTGVPAGRSRVRRIAVPAGRNHSDRRSRNRHIAGPAAVLRIILVGVRH